MASTPSLKENPQFGVGQYGAISAHDGLLGLRFAWGTSFGLVLPNIDKGLAQLSKGGGVGGGNLFGPNFNLFNSASLKMLEEIGHGLTHTQAAAVDKYITEAWAFEGIGAVIERMAHDAIQSRKLIVAKTAPAPIQRIVRPVERANLKPVIKRAVAAEERARHAEARAAALEKRVAHLERKTLHPNDGIVVGLPPRVGVGERDIERIKAGLRKISKYGSLAFFLALLLKALEKIGASWIRCGNVKQYGRGLCRMPSSILGSLIADTLLIAGVVSLVEFAAALVNVQEGITKTVLAGFKEFRDVEPMTFTGFTGELREFTGYTGTLG